MAFIQDLSSNSISVVVQIADKRAEDAVDILVHTFRSFGCRQSLKIGSRVRIKHVEMSAEKFYELAQLNTDFPGFRLTRYRALRSRGMLGCICGHTVLEREGLGDTIVFRYMDVEEHDDSGLVDPMFIIAPRNHQINHLLEN